MPSSGRGLGDADPHTKDGHRGEPEVLEGIDVESRPAVDHREGGSGTVGVRDHAGIVRWAIWVRGRCRRRIRRILIR